GHHATFRESLSRVCFTLEAELERVRVNCLFGYKTRPCPLPRAVNTLLSLHDFSKDRSLGPGCCSYDGMQRTSGAPSGLRGAGSISADSATSISAASISDRAGTAESRIPGTGCSNRS